MFSRLSDVFADAAQNAQRYADCVAAGVGSGANIVMAQQTCAPLKQAALDQQARVNQAVTPIATVSLVGSAGQMMPQGPAVPKTTSFFSNPILIYGGLAAVAYLLLRKRSA